MLTENNPNLNMNTALHVPLPENFQGTKENNENARQKNLFI